MSLLWSGNIVLQLQLSRSCCIFVIKIYLLWCHNSVGFPHTHVCVLLCTFFTHKIGQGAGRCQATRSNNSRELKCGGAVEYTGPSSVATLEWPLEWGSLDQAWLGGGRVGRLSSGQYTGHAACGHRCCHVSPATQQMITVSPSTNSI